MNARTTNFVDNNNRPQNVRPDNPLPVIDTSTIASEMAFKVALLDVLQGIHSQMKLSNLILEEGFQTHITEKDL